jgi:hypothetical protein
MWGQIVRGRAHAAGEKPVKFAGIDGKNERKVYQYPFIKEVSVKFPVS